MAAYRPPLEIAPLTTAESIEILFEEYRALYGLVSFRMSSLDRRIPIAWAGVATFLVTFAQTDGRGQVILLLALPVALIWFLGATVVHARSFEDVLRRIDEIERLVNHFANQELLVFQSRHPSQGRVGGRTGSDAVGAVYVTSITMLAVSSFLCFTGNVFSERARFAYLAYAGLVSCILTFKLLRLSRYRYRHTGTPGRPAPVTSR